MKLKVSLIAVAVMALVSIGSAQQGQGGGGGGRQGGFGGQRGGFGGAQRLIQLLRNPQVQEELKLTDDEKAKVEAMPRPPRGGGGGGGGRPAPPTPEEMATQLTEDKAAISAILTPDQEKRLEELRIQWAGPQAATLPDVQSALGLSDDQKAKIKDLQSKMAEANRGLGEKVRNQEIEMADARASMVKNNETFKTEVEKVLTADQQAKLKAMGGAELKQAPPVRRGGGGGAPPRA